MSVDLELKRMMGTWDLAVKYVRIVTVKTGAASEVVTACRV